MNESPFTFVGLGLVAGMVLSLIVSAAASVKNDDVMYTRGVCNGQGGEVLLDGGCTVRPDCGQ